MREYARLQGFPDSYVFGDVTDHSTSAATEVTLQSSCSFMTQTDASIIKQQFRQIGNAVPVPLAAALGRAIGKAVVQLWKDEDEDHMRVDSPEL